MSDKEKGRVKETEQSLKERKHYDYIQIIKFIL